ncbi:MAG: tetratricopeptide repeat protein [Candidatus Obscuribacterales bacterium]|nr:tetratricopeptide repeat protein [Candidatus Obscuribacterales bacterium]
MAAILYRLVKACIFLLPALSGCRSEDRSNAHLRLWEESRLQAEKACFKHDNKKFRRLAEQSAQEAEQLNDSNFYLAVSLNDLGDACRKSGKEQAALVVYKRGLSLLEKDMSLNTVEKKLLQEEKAKSLSRLAELYAQAGNSIDADFYYRKALESYDLLSRADNIIGQEYVNTLVGAAQVCCDRKDDQSAKKYFAQALALGETCACSEFFLDKVRKRYFEVLQALNCKNELVIWGANKRFNDSVLLADGALDRKNFAQAEALLKEAIAQRASISQSQKHLLKADLRLIDLYVRQKRILELENVCNQALAFDPLWFNKPYQPELDQILTVLATAYCADGQAHRAIPILEKQLSYRQKHYPQGSLNIANAEAALCRAYLISGKEKEANLKADAVFLMLIPDFESDKRAALAMSEVAAVYEELGDFVRAEKLYLKVHRLNLKLKDPFDARRVSGLISLARLYQRWHRYDLTNKVTNELINLVREMPLAKQIEISPYLVVLGQIYFSDGNFKQCKMVYSELQRIIVAGDNHLFLTSSLREEVRRNMKALRM